MALSRWGDPRPRGMAVTLARVQARAGAQNPAYRLASHFLTRRHPRRRLAVAIGLAGPTGPGAKKSALNRLSTRLRWSAPRGWLVSYSRAANRMTPLVRAGPYKSSLPDP